MSRNVADIMLPDVSSLADLSPADQESVPLKVITRLIMGSIEPARNSFNSY
jgi:hypothetical protein